MVRNIGPSPHRGKPGVRLGRAGYDWAQWADGTWHTLTLGRDLPDNTSVEAKRLAFSQWARRHWLPYETEILDARRMRIKAVVPRALRGRLR